MSNDANHLPELIDACRPSTDDLQLPELRELAQRVQDDPTVATRLQKSGRIDDLIGRAIREVPVPAGLEERLLSAVSCHAPQREPVSPAIELPVSTAVSEVALAKPGSARQSRFGGRKVWGTVAACAAALLAVVILVRPSKLQLESQADVAAASREWLESLSAERWQGGGFPDEQYPLPRQPRFRPYRWQQVTGDLRSPGAAGVVCYNISQDQPPHQLLFVGREVRSDHLSNVPPTTPTESTPGWLVGGWRASGSAGIVYVLAVRGGKLRYESLLQRTPTLASIR